MVNSYDFTDPNYLKDAIETLRTNVAALEKKLAKPSTNSDYAAALNVVLEYTSEYRDKQDRFVVFMEWLRERLKAGTPSA